MRIVKVTERNENKANVGVGTIGARGYSGDVPAAPVNGKLGLPTRSSSNASSDNEQSRTGPREDTSYNTMRYGPTRMRVTAETGCKVKKTRNKLVVTLWLAFIIRLSASRVDMIRG